MFHVKFQLQLITFSAVADIHRAGGTGCAGSANAHPLIDIWKLRPAFSRKKNFENPSKND